MIGVITALLTAFGAGAQNVARSPLLVGIVVEGLSADYLSLLEDHFTEGGFKRLMHRGATISDVYFGPGVDATAASAMIYTGTSPIVNGIPARMIYSPETNVATPTLSDPKSMGNFTDETYSPKAIKVSTLADELRMATEGDGSVYCVSADPQTAIISAGHAANGAFWIYDHTGNWASTTYYKEMPATVQNRNYRTPLHQRLDTMKWVPSSSMDSYPLLSATQRMKPFRYLFPSKQFDRFVRYKATPLANAEVTDLGIDLIYSCRLGKDNETDMLGITYNVTPSGTSPTETMDMYLRLDKDLARLFDAVDRSAGTGRATIFLAGTPARSNYGPDDAAWRVPTGEYSIRKAMSLLDMYLMATHGNGDWVKGYHNKQFFLNRKLITDRDLNLAAFRTEVADFLARMAGVSNVYTIDDIIAARAGDDPQGLKRNTSVKHCGDVIIEINPGWVIVDDGNSRPNPAERMNATRTPAFIMGPGVTPKRIDTRTDVRAIAPTVARMLRIRAPNGAAAGSLALD